MLDLNWDKVQLELIYLHKFIIRVVQIQPKPDNPVKPPDDNSIQAQTEGPVGRRRVSVLKNRHWRVEWQVRISKTRATRTRPKLQKNPAKSWKNKLDPARSRPDPAISGGI